MGFWPSKREIAFYYLLKRKLSKRFNVGDALDVSEQYYPRKVALNILKRLSKLGLLRRLSPTEYEIVDLEEWLDQIVWDYLESRRRRYSSSSS